VKKQSVIKIKPFTIDVPKEEVEELSRRLRLSRWPSGVDGNSGWRYGADLSFMRELVDYWLTAFDWRTIECRLNSLPQFVAEIDGMTIHFVHIRGSGVAKPLILTHGWPSSFAELSKIAPLLTQPKNHGLSFADGFDLILPSLPGFGFSSAPPRDGINTRSIAEIWHKLMLALGYEKYFVQGGDIGAGVSSWMARLYPGSVLGMHLNFLPGNYAPFTGEGSQPLSASEQHWRTTRQQWLEAEGGYSHQHSTKPLTLAYGLADSPVGLASWITEKFRSWSDCGGDLLSRFSFDELITNISIYWFSRNVFATLRIYKENRTSALAMDSGEIIRPPLSFASFPREICPPPQEWVKRGYNVVRWMEMPRGGHFAAMEEPLLLASDIHESFKTQSTDRA
jgi:pimeloyl-ACP methyl ester carboxylesterase